MFGFPFSFNGISPAMIDSGSSIDPDADNFLKAAGITDATQKTAVNNLVVNLKAANIWSKMKAVYPFVGGTNTTHKFNLINPLDTDAAFRLQFFGGWTHSSTGATPNGTTGYSNTFFNPVTQGLSYNNNHLSYYSRTSAGNTTYDMGSGNSTQGGTALYLYRTDTTGAYDTGTATGNRLSWSGLNGLGFFIGTSINTNIGKIFRNGTQLQTKNPLSNVSMQSYNFYLGGFNEQDTNTYYGNKECSFASIGEGLNDSESLLFNQIVEGYQFELGRNINSAKSFYYNTNYNNETNAFLYQTQITDTTIQSATNTLVSDLKSYNIWTKMKAIYPMVGGTSTTHKYNLKNPSDTDAAYRLSFSTGWTHSSTGATPNGSSAYADTFINALNNLNSNNHLSFYSRTSTVNTECELGAADTTVPNYLQLRLASGFFSGAISSGLSYTSTSDAKGFWIGTKRGNADREIYKNGVSEASTTTNDTTSLINANVYLGARNQPTNATPIALYSSKQCAFASIGDGLTDTEAADFYTAINKFQTTLSRNV